MATRLIFFNSALLLLVLLCALSCGGYGGAENGDDGRNLESVRGLILQVESDSLISLKSLDVEDGSGTEWHFEGRGKVVPGFTPSHLNEHKLLGQSVLVTFYHEGEVLVIENITD